MTLSAEELKAAGNAAFKAYKLDDAIELYSAAMAAEPSNAIFRANRSAALFEAGCYAQCIADVEGVLDGEPDSQLAAKLALRAARSAMWLQDYSAAERWLTRAQLSEGSLSAQAAAVADQIKACHTMASSGLLDQDAMASVSANSGADAPALVRGGVRRERREIFASGHDRPISMLAGPSTFTSLYQTA
jgi:tetratricopeptide (TPR) repeat protein